ncbi:hypothetical protein BGZ76_007187 [Entomortierella beljakovae]|nr:hypothetical protein BGZ76_007187 [Entomortierella beljakovae]
MPPKSSPVKSKTLGDFFIRDGSAATPKPNTDSNSQALTSAPESAVNLSPEKPKAKKKNSKVKTKESPEIKQSTTTDKASAKKDTPIHDETPIKPSPNAKSRRPKSEYVTAVTVPISSTHEKPVDIGLTKQSDNVPPPPPPLVTDSFESTQPSITETNTNNAATTTIATTSSTSTSSTLNSSTTGTSSAGSKLNKIDTASMFKVRSGKAHITESKLKFSAHPAAIAELCKFHEYREKLREAQDLSQYQGTRLDADHVEITKIPEEYNGLIAKLSEESDLLLSDIANNILAILCPAGFETMEDVVSAHDSDEKMDMDVDSVSENVPTVRNISTVSISALTEAIQSVATRVNYGVPVSSLPNYVTATPPNLSVYRWEVQDIDQYFPSDMKSAVLKRRRKRMEASAALTAWYLGLEAKQQEDLCPILITPSTIAGADAESQLGNKRGRSLNATENMEVDAETGKMSTDGNGITRPGVILLEGQPTVAAALNPAILESKLKEAETKKKEAEAKEERRLEKERRLAEKQLEKDMKEAERIQKEESKKRKAEEERLKKEQTSMRFVGFFKPISSPAQKKDGSQPSTKTDVATSALSELFHPFHVKKDTTLAPINRFAKDISKEVIDNLLNGKETSGSCTSMDVDLDTCVPVMTDNKKVKEILSKILPRAQPKESSSHPKKKLPRRYRSMTVAKAVQSGVLLQDEDDDTNYMLTWRDIPSLRMRLFQFAENYRPAYYGTWSKQTKLVGGRRFLGKDTELIDYDFDSEAEWEEDEEGEECKSDDDEEDADEPGSDQDDEDDWLVPEGYLSEDEGLDAGEEGGPEGGSLKKLKEPRRATLAQMVPVIVGPVFEITLGESTCHPALEPYRVEFLGDFGIGMDLYHAIENRAS